MDEYELLVGGVCVSSGAASPLWLCASSILITSACEGEACNDERAEFIYVPSSRSGEEERDESNSNSNDCMVSPGEVVRAVGLYELLLTLAGHSMMVSGNLASILSGRGLHERAATRLGKASSGGIERL